MSSQQMWQAGVTGLQLALQTARGLSRNANRGEEAEKRREERFILNLSRMKGTTEAVTIDCFIEVLVHITNANVVELVSLESDYLGVIFTDAEFNCPACSVEVFIAKYEQAKEDKDDQALAKIREVHRKARLCLNSPDRKQEIQALINKRLGRKQRNMYFGILYDVIGYLDEFGGGNALGTVFETTLTGMIGAKEAKLLIKESGEVPPENEGNK